MKKPKICAVIIDKDLAAVRDIEEFADLFEVRIDLTGEGWQEMANQLKRPWIACNRTRAEGGRWHGGETKRIEELIKASELGADMVDIELMTEGLAEIVPLIKKRSKCLLSNHDLKETPSLEELKEIVRRQLAAGADICKVVTTTQKFEDNIRALELISAFPGTEIVSFAMGDLGMISRVLSPLIGAKFTYASVKKGKESASGQITARELHRLYEQIAIC
jgi:3-dehydroquinate dehydratase type I